MAAPQISGPGKLICFLAVVFVNVVSSEATYTCTYLEKTGCCWWSRQVMKTMQCQHGCCGDGVDQQCCDPDEEEEGFNRKLWMILAGVFGGLVFLSLIIIVVLCILKKKNARRSRIYDGDGPGDYALSSRRKRDPHPPYSPLNIFIVGGSGQNERGAVETSADNLSGHRHHRSPQPFGERTGPPPGSQRHPSTDDQEVPFGDSSQPPPDGYLSIGMSIGNQRHGDPDSWPPTFNGEASNPPPYSFVDSNPSEWRRWEAYSTKSAKD